MTDIASSDPGSADQNLPLFELIEGFVVELRSAGLPVSLVENIDAIEAAKEIPLDDRDAFKYALAATLVKNQAHWKTFETLFEVYFSIRGAEYVLDPDADNPFGELDLDLDEMEGQGEQPPGQGGQGGSSMSPEEMAEMLFKALLNSDQTLMKAIAKQAVKRFAGMEPGRPVGGTYYLYRTLRNLDLDGVMERMMAEAAKAEGKEQFEGLEKRLKEDEFNDRIEAMKKEIEAEIRRRLVADRGAEAMAKTLRKPLPEDVDFMHASREEMAKIKQAIYPLTRKLAVRLSRKRKHKRKGALDFRRTVRASLSYGGVPAEPKFRNPHPAKPEIMVIADISGSVAAFARFTLHLVYAISGQFSKVRSFVFIDGLDEVTHFFDKTDDINQAVHRVNTEADVVWVDGHSDYGHAFEVFWENYGSEITPKTTVLILGDARNNYHASQSWIIKEVEKKARKVFWLNPEPKAYWNTGDSIVGEYGEYTNGLFEVRTLRQLEKFVDNLA